MHILVGALIGCVCGVIGAVVMSVVFKRPLTWKTLAIGAVAGLVGGAITSATLGAGGVAAATAVRTATAYVAGGTGGSAAGRVYENLLEEKPPLQDVPKAAAIGAATGIVSYGGVRVAEPLLRNALPGFANFWFGEVPEAAATPRAPPVVTPPSETPGLTKALDEVSSVGR
jgi:hypothetical protein